MLCLLVGGDTEKELGLFCVAVDNRIRIIGKNSRKQWGVGEKGEGLSGTCVKDTWTKPKWGRIECGRAGWLW